VNPIRMKTSGYEGKIFLEANVQIDEELLREKVKMACDFSGGLLTGNAAPPWKEA